MEAQKREDQAGPLEMLTDIYQLELTKSQKREKLLSLFLLLIQSVKLVKAF